MVCFRPRADIYDSIRCGIAAFQKRTLGPISAKLPDETDRQLLIEIMFGRLKDGRRVATRYDRCPKVILSAVALAAIVIFRLRVLSLRRDGLGLHVAHDIGHDLE
ncbi:hypothetical protein SAMN05444004_10810 [Jannaschia faecimaris]|uniref:Transposase DDE domain-containing protein n=1 Tax=Jannaschia faecimaris TaxID=1244108 RepID=A0A1H3R8K2_9RHOB|nr:hypothetical protein SAMN05444004_10810 [Jannaschia faecimaris]